MSAWAKASTISSNFPLRNTWTGSSKRSGDVTDADYMARALFHAARGRGRTSPNPVVSGRGFQFLESRGIAVDIGTCRAAAVLLNQPFFTLMNEGRPFVTM